MAYEKYQIILFAIIFLLQYFFEHIYPQRKELNDWNNERKNILTGLINVALIILPSAALVGLLRFIDKNNLGLLQQLVLPFWIQVVVTIFIMDLWMYAWHRMNHTQPLLWRFHRFHHTDEKMNTTTAIRFHFAELFLSYFGKAAVCFVAGLVYTPVLIYELLFFISIVIHHSNIKISVAADKWYRVLFSSPHMHRIHHSTKKEERDSNYGSLFSFWDGLFGTTVYKDPGDVKFGVEERVV